MRCHGCKKDINRGSEMAKMVTYFLQEDGSLQRECTYDGAKHTSGKMVQAWHYKCDKVRHKRTVRGDPVTGRGLGNDMPTAYDIGGIALNHDDLEAMGITVEEAKAMGTGKLSERATQIRRDFLEKAAKGEVSPEDRPFQASWRKLTPEEIAARDAQASILRSREQDPGHKEYPESDWRDQQCMEVSEVPQVSDPDELLEAPTAD